MSENYLKANFWMDLPGGHRVGWRAYSGVWPLIGEGAERLLRGLEAQDVEPSQLAVIKLPTEWEETPFILMLTEYGTLESQLFMSDGIDYWAPVFCGEFLAHLPPLEEEPNLERLVFKEAKR